MIQTACFCSANGIRTEPRFRRHALAFARAFPNVKVLLFDGGTVEPTEEDRGVFQGLDNVVFHRVIFPTKSTQLTSTVLTKIRMVISRALFQCLGRSGVSALSMRANAFAKGLSDVQADLFFCYTIDSCLPVWRSARRNHGRMVFDSMEYFADMTSEQDPVEKRLIAQIQRQVFPDCEVILASSEQLATAVSRDYKHPNVVAIFNAPAAVSRTKPKPPGLDLYWRNTIVAFSERGLQDVLHAMVGTPENIRLFVQGFPGPNDSALVREKIDELSLTHRVHLLQPHGPDEAVTSAAAYHVGLCPEQSGSLN